MKIKYVLYGKLTDDVIAGIADILTACNDEFVPPLSERHVTSEYHVAQRIYRERHLLM